MLIEGAIATLGTTAFAFQAGVFADFLADVFAGVLAGVFAVAFFPFVEASKASSSAICLRLVDSILSARATARRFSPASVVTSVG